MKTASDSNLLGIEFARNRSTTNISNLGHPLSTFLGVFLGLASLDLLRLFLVDFSSEPRKCPVHWLKIWALLEESTRNRSSLRFFHKQISSWGCFIYQNRSHWIVLNRMWCEFIRPFWHLLKRKICTISNQVERRLLTLWGLMGWRCKVRKWLPEMIMSVGQV